MPITKNDLLCMLREYKEMETMSMDPSSSSKMLAGTCSNPAEEKCFIEIGLIGIRAKIALVEEMIAKFFPGGAKRDRKPSKKQEREASIKDARDRVDATMKELESKGYAIDGTSVACTMPRETPGPAKCFNTVDACLAGTYDRREFLGKKLADVDALRAKIVE